MGVGPFKLSSSSYDTVSCKPSVTIRPDPNPNPYNYRILDGCEHNGNLLVVIEYPDCTNYEGRKVMVYKNTTMEQLKSQLSIDPHFSNNKKMLSPFVRVEPSTEGYLLAFKILMML